MSDDDISVGYKRANGALTLAGMWRREAQQIAAQRDAAQAMTVRQAEEITRLNTVVAECQSLIKQWQAAHRIAADRLDRLTKSEAK